MFRVEWVDAAVEELAAIWLRVDSDERRGVTTAANAIDVALRSDPIRESESRDDERGCCSHRRWVYPSASTCGVGSFESAKSGTTNRVRSNSF